MYFSGHFHQIFTYIKYCCHLKDKNGRKKVFFSFKIHSNTIAIIKMQVKNSIKLHGFAI